MMHHGEQLAAPTYAAPALKKYVGAPAVAPPAWLIPAAAGVAVVAVRAVPLL